eukprot:COSAG06_NODE_6182_length_3061_cov_29.177920_4_plen_205_part_00
MSRNWFCDFLADLIAKVSAVLRRLLCKSQYNTLLVLLRAGFETGRFTKTDSGETGGGKVLQVLRVVFFHRDLYSLVFGESVLNDAVAIVLYQARNNRNNGNNRLMTPAACFCHAVVVLTKHDDLPRQARDKHKHHIGCSLRFLKVLGGCPLSLSYQTLDRFNPLRCAKAQALNGVNVASCEVSKATVANAVRRGKTPLFGAVLY